MTIIKRVLFSTDCDLLYVIENVRIITALKFEYWLREMCLMVNSKSTYTLRVELKTFYRIVDKKRT